MWEILPEEVYLTCITGLVSFFYHTLIKTSFIHSFIGRPKTSSKSGVHAPSWITQSLRFETTMRQLVHVN